MKHRVYKGALALIVVLAALDLYLILSRPSQVEFKSHKPGAIVRLVEEQGNTFCSGTVITPHTVLTAAHCVISQTMLGMSLERKNIGIRPSNNMDLKVIANVKRVRYQMDQAILEGDFSQFQTAEFIPDVGALDSNALKHSKMTACGYPLGGRLFCTTILYIDRDAFMWKVYGLLLPGMSGGPVFLSNGAVIATNVAVEANFSIISPIYGLDLEL